MLERPCQIKGKQRPLEANLEYFVKYKGMFSDTAQSLQTTFSAISFGLVFIHDTDCIQRRRAKSKNVVLTYLKLCLFLEWSTGSPMQASSSLD